MFKAERNGLPLVLTVHDELIGDAIKRPDNAKVLKQIMEDRPQWAIDIQLPVEAETWSGDRYKK
jgi:DNA polymerase I-like protein with 3'-5' exonuclease and polymerase domains